MWLPSVFRVLLLMLMIISLLSFLLPHHIIMSEPFVKLVIVRHGESEWNQANRFCGWFDADLSELGVREAQEAGKV
jgi:hypothetical protein